MLIGIEPSRPETGYGYIRGSQDANAGLPEGIKRVAQFVEKPDEARAQSYLESGDYYWNSGMFLFRASVFLDELKKHDPDIYDTCWAALERSVKNGDEVLIDPATFACCPDNSIDYAVMEKTQLACVVPMSAGWSDVGSWSSIWDVHEKDENGNVLKGDVIAEDTRNCLVHGNGKLVTVLGLSYMWLCSQCDALGKDIKGKEKELAEAQKRLVSEQDRWSYITSPANLERAKTMVEIAEQSYAAGALTSLDVIDAQLAATGSRLARDSSSWAFLSLSSSSMSLSCSWRRRLSFLMRCWE